MMRTGLIFIVISLISVSIFAADEIRCEGKGLPQERCNQIRDAAVKSGCIDRDTYDRLVRENRCPSCNSFGDYMGSCPPGCFARGTRILVSSVMHGGKTWVPVENIVANPEDYLVWALDTGSQKKNPKLKAFEIRNVVHGPEELPLIKISTKGGAILSLTTEHAVLLSSGIMVAAKHLRSGNEIVRSSGQVDQITLLEQVPTTDEVFNILLDVDTPVSHSIIAEDLIVGDQYWQGVLIPLLNHTLLHE